MDFNTSVAQPTPVALDLRPPNSPSPLETLAQLNQFKSQQLQQTGLQQENQQRAYQLQDQQTMRSLLPQLLQDPNNQTNGQPDWNKVVQGLAPHVSPSTAFGLQQVILGNQEKAANIRKADADSQLNVTKAHESELDYLGSVGLGLQKTGYNPAVIDATLAHAETLSPLYKDSIEQVRQAIAQNPANAKMIVDGMVTQSQKATQEAREATSAQATTAKTEAETKASQLTQQLTQAKVDLFKTLQTPGALEARVAGSIDPQKYPDEYARALNEARLSTDAEGIDKAISRHSALVGEQEKTVSTALNPQIRQAKISDEVAASNAKIPGEITKAVQTQLALAKNSPDAFAAIADPRTRAAAESEYEKDSNDYADKVGSARQLRATIAAAQGGNKAAPAVIPIEELKQFVNRVNRNELQQVQGGGNLFERVQGFVNKYTEGQPIPPAVMNDMLSLSNLQESAAQNTYANKVKINNATHGGKVQPIDLSQSGPSGGGPSGGGHTIQIGQKKYQYNGSGDTADLKNYSEIKQ